MSQICYAYLVIRAFSLSLGRTDLARAFEKSHFLFCTWLQKCPFNCNPCHIGKIKIQAVYCQHDGKSKKISRCWILGIKAKQIWQCVIMDAVCMFLGVFLLLYVTIFLLYLIVDYFLISALAFPMITRETSCWIKAEANFDEDNFLPSTWPFKSRVSSIFEMSNSLKQCFNLLLYL